MSWYNRLGTRFSGFFVAPAGHPFPRTAIIAIGGDQQYNPVPYSSQVAPIEPNGYFSSATYGGNPIPWMGRHDVVLVNGDWEGWDNNNTYDRFTLVDCIKQTLNVSAYSPSIVWQYSIMEVPDTTVANNPYPTWNQACATNHWYLYTGANQTGATVPVSGTTVEGNWAAAWPLAQAGTAADQCFTPARTTAHYDGSPEDPPQFFAAYAPELAVVRHSAVTGQVGGYIPASAYSDPRFAFDDSAKAPNVDAIMLDNCFAFPRYAGYYDLQTSYAAYLSNSPAGAWMLRGSQHFFARYQQIMQRAYPGRTYYNIGNLASWDYSFVGGNFANATSGLVNTLHGGIMEGAMGATWSIEGYGWLAVLQSYNAEMDFCLAPKHLMFVAYPATTTSYQQMRYYLTTGLMDDGYVCLAVANSYIASNYIWWDEYGGNPGTNIPKGWLGYPLGARPAAPAINGVWLREFTNGVVACNPKGNGPQTLTATQIAATLGHSVTLSFFKGVQNPSFNTGAAFASVNLADGDGVLLLKG